MWIKSGEKAFLPICGGIAGRSDPHMLFFPPKVINARLWIESDNQAGFPHPFSRFINAVCYIGPPYSDPPYMVVQGWMRVNCFQSVIHTCPLFV